MSARVLTAIGVAEHNSVLVGPGQQAHTPNWAMTQWKGLIQSCVTFPEMRNCSGLLSFALYELEGWLDTQAGSAQCSVVVPGSPRARLATCVRP